MGSGIVVEETRLPKDRFKLANKDIEKPRDLSPQEKITFELESKILYQRANNRQSDCWMKDGFGCNHAASNWIVRVTFDFKGDKAAYIQHKAISTEDYDGPVPGFCDFCLSKGAETLAEKVYFSRPEMAWGVKPRRWFVELTDGTIIGGLCIQLDPRQEFLDVKVITNA